MCCRQGFRAGAGLDRYVAAWHDGDVDALVTMLTADAVLSMPPLPGRFSGPASIRAFLVSSLMADPGHGAGVPLLFQREIGYGDMITAFLALVALVALRTRSSWAIPLVWLVVVVGLLDTINAIIQSLRYNVFVHALSVNWVIVTIYVPALLVSSALIFWQLTRSPVGQTRATMLAGQH
jgi:hypothetical protein